ncbi:hypothetical protein [Limnohabitans sp.]|jgi:hypothetical protein|uniref:hypothetical protein n=1 Tax=Limnohabitans sp. TaxID=1907725 RepID=UPI00333EE3E1
MSRYYMSTTVEVDVDITEDDLTNDDLLELCKERGIAVSAEIVDELYQLFKLKKHDAILERMRVFVQDAKGVVL